MEKVILFSVCSVLLVSVIKKYSPDYSILLSLAAGTGILLFSVNYAVPVLSLIKEYSEAADIAFYQTEILFKAIACAYISQFAAEICRDSGESAIASKIESAAKIIIGSMSLPVMISLFEYLREIAGGL